MARLSALCDPDGTGSVSPYGGRDTFVDERPPRTEFRVEFANTPADQRLDLTPMFPPEPT
jgi:hypothetical protein